MRLVLASASPRRRELLPLLGIPFEVVEPGIEELTEGEARELVLANAREKARAGLAVAGSGATVIGCDTDVELDGEVLGKPDDAEGARHRLRRLSGCVHQVHSGVWVLGEGEGGTGAGDVVTTSVRFRELSPAEVDAYVATGEWRGRAGGYAIQGFGSGLVDRIDGDLSNVIGLPLPLTARLIAGLQDG